MGKEYQTPEIEIIEFDAEVQMMLTLSNTPQENIDNDFNLDNSGWEVQNKFLDKNKTDRENCRTDSLGCFIYENKFGNYQ